MIGRQAVFRLATDALFHHPNLWRTDMVREIAVGSVGASQHLKTINSITIAPLENNKRQENRYQCTKKARNPRSANECSTPTILVSLTHLSTRWLETKDRTFRINLIYSFFCVVLNKRNVLRIMITGPETNLTKHWQKKVMIVHESNR
jgi:hypothetical protein